VESYLWVQLQNKRIPISLAAASFWLLSLR
jgi:hypothetical protein